MHFLNEQKGREALVFFEAYHSLNDTLKFGIERYTNSIQMLTMEHESVKKISIGRK